MLIEGCYWQWANNFNGSLKHGLLGTSKANGATIFLPATYADSFNYFATDWYIITEVYYTKNNNIMRKRLLTTTALLLGAMCASAAVQYMTVEQKSGAKYSFLLKDNPVVTYKGGELVVNGSASTSYAIDGVKNYHFTETDQTGVETTGADMLRITTIFISS